MSTRAWLLLAVTAAFVAFEPSNAHAQCVAAGQGGTCSQPGSVSLTVGRVVQLQMSATSTSLTAPTSDDFDAGMNATTGPTLTISANAPWRLYVRSTTAAWTAANTSPGAPARTDKPASDLRWSTASGGPFVDLTTTDANLVEGLATALSATTLYFHTLYSWTLDTPGNYGLTLVLSLTTP